MPENPASQPTLNDLLKADEEPSQKDEAIAQLEGDIQRLENKYSEERFIWIVVSIVLFDAFVFTYMVNWAGALVIGVIELLVLVIVADRCKVDAIAPIIDKMAGGLSKHIHREK